MIRNARFRIAATLLVLLPLGACENGPAGPDDRLTIAHVAGAYRAGDSYGAWELTTTDDQQTTDWLEAGASVELSLASDGRTAGRIFVPGAEEDGSDWEADLAGTWSLTGNTVRFQHPADTFIRDMPFEVVGSTLVGDRTFGGTRVRMVLRKM